MILAIHILLILSITYSQEKSSSDIQNEINSRNTQIQLLKKEITEVEKRIIEKTKNEINASEIIIELEKKIKLTEKLIQSLERDEGNIKQKINESQIQIIEKKRLVGLIQEKIKFASLNQSPYL